jgi:hypothetical protein
MPTTTCFERPVSISIKLGDAEPPRISPEPELSVFVVFTSINWTLKAVERAREMAKPIGANVVVIAVQVVPYPLPLHRPPVPMEFVIRRFEEEARESLEGTMVSAYLCRDPLIALKRILKPNCPVVMGIRKRWWPTSDERLARKLRRAGYKIALVETE